MASAKLSVFPDLAGQQAPADLVYVVVVSAGIAGSKRSTLNDLFAFITKNITDGAVRFQQFAPPALSGAGEGAIYFDAPTDRFRVSENAAAYVDLINGGVIGRTTIGGTVGSVLFVGAGSVLAQDNANLFWDDPNNRLGIRINAPLARLHAHLAVDESVGLGLGPLAYFGVPLTDLTVDQQDLLKGAVIQIATKNNDPTSVSNTPRTLSLVHETDFQAGSPPQNIGVSFATFDRHTSNPGGPPEIFCLDLYAETRDNTASSSKLNVVRATANAKSNAILDTLIGIDAIAKVAPSAGPTVDVVALKAFAFNENGSDTNVFDALAVDMFINKAAGTVSFAALLDVGFQSSIAGNCDTLVGLWIASFASLNATNKIAIRTDGPELVRFGGRCVIGTAGGRSASEISLQVSSPPAPTAAIIQSRNNTTPVWELWPAPWQVQAEASTDPTSTQLVAGNHFSLYRKNDKFVIAVSILGVINYLSIPLDGITTAWSWSTVAP